MALGAKILAAAAILCIVLWAAVLFVGAQPLTVTDALQVIYGEQEEFFADAVVYRKVSNGASYFLYMPRARPAYRWWSLDLKDMTITSGISPRSLGSRKYLLRGDRGGIPIDNREKMGDWYWHFTETGAAFSGNGFTCKVRRLKF